MHAVMILAPASANGDRPHQDPVVRGYVLGGELRAQHPAQDQGGNREMEKYRQQPRCTSERYPSWPGVEDREFSCSDCQPGRRDAGQQLSAVCVFTQLA